VLVCVNVCVDVPDVWLKLLINDNAIGDAENVVISEFDKVEFICTSSARPPVVTWR